MAGNKQPSVSESTQDPADLALKEPSQRLGTWKIATIPLRFMQLDLQDAHHLVVIAAGNLDRRHVLCPYPWPALAGHIGCHTAG